MRARQLSVVALLVACAALYIGGCRRENPAPMPMKVAQGTAMGTTWQVTVVDDRATQNLDTLSLDITNRLEQIESQMSHWRDDSIVSRLNRSESTAAVEITPDLSQVISEAERIHAQTQGAFDITAAQLVNLWGFGPSGRQHDVPSDAQIKDALADVGSEQLTLSGTTLSKQRPGVQIDLSALAKGYAIDMIAQYLDTQQCENYLIQFGGELRARGHNAEGSPWQVGLEQPDPRSSGVIRRTIPLVNQSIATSGSYRNFQRDAGDTATTYSHIIDPRTGRPVTHQLASVSVIADTAMRADALATALMVLGPEEGYRWAIEHNLAATFVSITPEGQTERSTPAFGKP